MNYITINREYVGFYIVESHLILSKYDFRLKLTDFISIPLTEISKYNVIGRIIELTSKGKKRYFHVDYLSSRKFKKHLKQKNILFETENVSFSKIRMLRKQIQRPLD